MEDWNSIEKTFKDFGVEMEGNKIKKDVTAQNTQESGAEDDFNIILPQEVNYEKRLIGTKINRKKKYLQVALNSGLIDAKRIINSLPVSDRIIIEAGTPLIKKYGTRAVSEIRDIAPSGTYIVADSKIADLAEREVKMMADAGASAITCLGVAPMETINIFLEKCSENGVDSMIDMMNVEDPLSVLKKLKKIPTVVILHRGVDEGEYKKEKTIPYYQIKQVKGNYNIMVAVAGGDAPKEIESAIFNDADIVVLWKSFFSSNNNIKNIAENFLTYIK